MNQVQVREMLRYNLFFIALSKDEMTAIKKGIEEYKYCRNINVIKKKELNEELYNAYKFHYHNILMIGDTDMSSVSANSLMDRIKIDQDKLTINYAYKCHCCDDWEHKALSKNMPLHEDGLSSWNCLMEKLRNPKWGIIIDMAKEN